MQTPTYYLEALDPRSFRAVGGLLRSATSDILTSAQIIKQDIDDDEVSMAFGSENVYRR